MGPLSLTSLNHLQNATKHIIKFYVPSTSQLIRPCSTQATTPTHPEIDTLASRVTEPLYIQPEHHAVNYPRQPLAHGEGAGKKPRASADKFTMPSLFNDEVVAKFINIMMHAGKKELSRDILEKTFEEIKKTRLKEKRAGSPDIETDPLVIFHDAYKNVQPKMGIVTKRKGGKQNSVPYPVTDTRRRFLGMKWLIACAQKRPGTKKPMEKKLSEEIIDAFNGEGGAISRKMEMHKAAEANRAYAHFRWW